MTPNTDCMPKVVAVIGASNDRRKFGNRAVRAYQQQGYTVIPINPHEAYRRRAAGLLGPCSTCPGLVHTALFYVPPDVRRAA